MNSKHFIWIGAFVGGIVGGYIPVLFGADSISMATIIGNMIGGLAGIWGGFKLTQMF